MKISLHSTGVCCMFVTLPIANTLFSPEICSVWLTIVTKLEFSVVFHPMAFFNIACTDDISKGLYMPANVDRHKNVCICDLSSVNQSDLRESSSDKEKYECTLIFKTLLLGENKRKPSMLELTGKRQPDRTYWVSLITVTLFAGLYIGVFVKQESVYEVTCQLGKEKMQIWKCPAWSILMHYSPFVIAFEDLFSSWRQKMITGNQII